MNAPAIAGDRRMRGAELTVLAATRGEEVYVPSDGYYMLGATHQGRGREKGRYFQDVLSLNGSGKPEVIFSIRAEGGQA